MKIQLLHSLANRLEFKSSPDGEIKEDSFDFSFSVAYNEQEDKNTLFAIIFILNLKCRSNYQLDIEYVSHFQTSEPITEEFKNSHFPKINAPAIAFPFLRSFIATLTLNAGYDPILLPSINFTRVKKTESVQVEP